MTKRPVYEMVINESLESDIEVSFIALVDKPAIERNFLTFKNAKGEFVTPNQGETKDDFISRCIPLLINEGKEQDQAVAICSSLWDTSKYHLNFKLDTEKRIISGPAMVANSLIYRKDENGEYDVFFSKDTIEQIAIKFFKKDYQKNLNLFHDPNLPIDGVTIFESFISDKSRNIPAMVGYEDLPDGSWFISAKVENDAVWEKIKSGEVKGFSVEGFFSSMKVKAESIEQKIFNILSATTDKKLLLKENDSFMSKIKDLIGKFKKDFFDVPPVPAPTPTPAPVPDPANKFADYMTKDGKTVSIDKMEVGGIMQMAGAPCPAGEYELQDGTKVTVGEGGVISAVTPVQMAAAITMEQVNAAIAQAIEAYKATTVQATTQIETKLTAAEATVAKQTSTIKELFVIVEQIAELPTGAPVESSRQIFVKKFEENKDEKIKALSTRLQTLKKAQ